jgi:predicted esterase
VGVLASQHVDGAVAESLTSAENQTKLPCAPSPETDRVHEHHIRVPRRARYVTLGEPAAAPREIWVVCHGYAQLAARFLRHFARLDDGTRLIVAPEALNRFYLGDASGFHGPDAKIGATWMTREDRENEIADYVEYLDLVSAEVLAALPRAPERVVALGFSQGVATVTRWYALGNTRIDSLVLWAGLLPPDAEQFVERLRTTMVTFVVGTRDRSVHGALAGGEGERVRQMNVPWRLVTFDGGHEMHGETLRALAE